MVYEPDLMAEAERDIEESAELLNEAWEPVTQLPRRREVLPSVVEYSLPSLHGLLEAGRINLAPRYQRRSRWGKDRQSRLIESFIMNVPVPPIYLNEDRTGVLSVIDGKQRLLSIRAFFEDRLELEGLKFYPELNGLTHATLPTDVRNSLDTLPSLRSIIILAESNERIKYEVFLRLNTGGVQLNAQEIRNSSWPGPFNDLVLELSESQRFRDMLRILNPEKSAIVREMRDAELVLRFFTFQRTWRGFTGGIGTALNDFMVVHQYDSATELAELQASFERGLDCVQAALGALAFRRWVPESATWRNQVLAALFDAEMIGLVGNDPEWLRQHSEAFTERFKNLFVDADFREAIDAATNTPALLQRRIQKVQDLVSGLV